ncbi:possible transcriptional regulator [Alloactinosynnema sp. L-07]|uniref:ATP-binding protein n=1 Tax=Alloactinosynnema sp. L-07 TaxID=1653480 RepID=UPI00065F03E4|nr:LuxR family transcriptional regulator [Alloactinosynnema sp. L-07]CRK61936.1 possible transcriptional regulator [Alloactinosynnema sp. L-07]
MSVLIGRDGELTRLNAAVDAAASGRGAVLLIVGRAGIGKTRLVEHVVARSAECGLRVARGNCVPDEGAPALWPWWQALGDRPALAARLDLDGADDVSPQLSAAHRLRAYDLLLRELSGTVVLEDLHWADESTLTLLRLAVGRPGLLVVATYRDDEQPQALRTAVAHLRRDPATEVLAPGPWTPAEVAAFVAGRVDASWVPVLHRVSGGIPLFVGELLAALLAADGTSPAPASGEWPHGVPEHLRGIVAAQLDVLPPEVRELVTACSVIGVDSAPDEVAVLVDAPVESVLRRAEAAPGLLRCGDRVTFGHALVRDAVYDGVSAADRVRLHRELAEAIESGVLAGESVTHRLRSVTDGASRAAAVRACRTAAAKAVSRLAYDRAAEVIDAAHGVLREPDVDLLLEAADLHYRAGRAEQALRRCELAASLDPSPDQLVRAALTVRGIDAVSDRLIPLCDKALAVVEDDAGRARVLAQRALALIQVVHSDQAEEPSRAALALAERTGDPLAIADALRARQQVLGGPWWVAERLDLARRLLDLGSAAPPDSELWARVWRIDAALQLGTIAVLDDELAHLRLYADRLGWLIAHWHHHRLSGVRAVLLGAFDLAEAEADHALAVAEQLGDFGAILLDVAFRSELRRLQGRGPEFADRVFQLSKHAAMPVVAATVGRFLLDVGDIDNARAMFERLRPILPTLPRDGRWLPTVAASAILAGAFDDAETAAALYAELLPMAGYYLAAGAGTVVCVGSISRQLGRVAVSLGDRDAAIRHFEDAVSMDTRIGALPFRAKAEVALAEVLVDGRAPEVARAAKLAGQAAVTARRLGMAPTVAAADAVLRRVRQARHDAVPLTVREREVLRLLAVGAPNRAIAENLVLSERTVETHVSNVLGKLGVANRAQAAAWAAENGFT